MKILRTSLWLLVFLAFTVRPVAAQIPDNYTLKLYATGATLPISTTPLPTVEVLCNQTALPASAVNPVGFQWDDPNNVGRKCIWKPVPLTSGPIVPLATPGIYDSAVNRTTPAGTSPDSAKVPFSKALPPAAPTGLAPVR